MTCIVSATNTVKLKCIHVYGFYVTLFIFAFYLNVKEIKDHCLKL